MSEAKHTPEPWRIERRLGWFEIKGADGTVAADDGSANEEYSAKMSPENARRIVACVNACKGIPIEVLETPGYSINDELDTLDSIINEREHARKQRSELLSVIKRLYSWNRAEVEHFGATCPDDDIIDAVEKAIKNGEE